MLQSTRQRVFLNIPYDEAFQGLYIAYLVGLDDLGLAPVLTLEDATGTTRIDRLFHLLRSCAFSIHDLSRIELSVSSGLPRFNMPFELGLAVSLALTTPASHTWIGFDSERYQAQRTLSDLAGSDFNIHGNTQKGVLAALCNVFVREARPLVPDMLLRVRVVEKAIPALLDVTGADDVYSPRMLHEVLQILHDSGPAKPFRK